MPTDTEKRKNIGTNNFWLNIAAILQHMEAAIFEIMNPLSENERKGSGATVSRN